MNDVLAKCRMVFVFLLALLPFAAQAQALERDHVRGSLIASVASVAPGTEFDVLFHQDIDAGWHTYWISPGDSGAPPDIRWEPVEGVSVSEFRYPFPERIAYGPLMNYGYHDTVYLPFTVTVSENFKGGQLNLKGSGRVLVCADICIPQKMVLELTLPLGERAGAPEHVVLFEEAAAKMPVLLAVSNRVEATEDTIELHLGLPVAKDARIRSVEFFPYEQDVINNPAPQLFSITESGLKLTLTSGFEFDSETSDLSGVLVLREDVGDGVTSAFEMVIGQPGSALGADEKGAPIATDGATEEDGMSMVAALFFAFLGGVILNLMPCVFPVLSIKILSLIESVHDEGESIKMHGIAYAGGVIGSFVAIAALLLILRATGDAIGWGFQLQSPIVVSLLAYLFVLIGLNLLGVFEVGLSMMSFGTGSSSRGGQGSRGYLGSISTGVLATIVAAPCTAPFMGAAVGYALLQSMTTGLFVFAALGAGMALPYVLLCYSPSLLARLPRPGNWMVGLKQFLAFPMFASAIWLVWVLGIQAGPTAMMQVLGGSLILALAGWLLGQRFEQSTTRVLSIMMIVTLAGIAVVIALRQEPAPALMSSATSPDSLAAGEPGVYSKQSLAKARQSGPVFVNFTAAWCITCKVNEINALNTSSVKEGFVRYGVTYLRADWTNEDSNITAALQEYGRSGVPLYLLYEQGTGEARVLPQILTQGIVLEALAGLKIVP
jgi:thiol:disulfide interchange protein/DsbC/DsbD-like thiol-disulfide interchange protein